MSYYDDGEEKVSYEESFNDEEELHHSMMVKRQSGAKSQRAGAVAVADTNDEDEEHVTDSTGDVVADDKNNTNTNTDIDVTMSSLSSSASLSSRDDDGGGTTITATTFGEDDVGGDNNNNDGRGGNGNVNFGSSSGNDYDDGDDSGAKHHHHHINNQRKSLSQNQQQEQEHHQQQQAKNTQFDPERERQRQQRMKRLDDWLSSFRRLDPRYKILHFFNDVAQDGADNIEKEGLIQLEKNVVPTSTSFTKLKRVSQQHFRSPLLRSIFSRASVFSVWRPTSLDAIRYMMLGQAVGKGLDIKGKSAKRGMLSAFVPFLQIFNDEHTDKIKTLKKDGRIRIFFQTKEDCDEVNLNLKRTRVKMLGDVAQGRIHNRSGVKKYEMSDPRIVSIDDYAPNCYGLDIPERLFWEGMIIQNSHITSISRDVGTQGELYNTGRPSVPQFQDMNFDAIRKHVPAKGKPRPVIFQYDTRARYNDSNSKLGSGENKNNHGTTTSSIAGSPMNPFTLLMAYEESEFSRVLPVVSDFDCFLVGTRGVNYTVPIHDDQLDVMKWSIQQIETIMSASSSTNNGKSWTSQWLDVLKKEARNGFHPTIPALGFSDPKTCSIMENAIERLSESGAVRHGAESFNFYFPQDLDDEFLVISDHLPPKNNKFKSKSKNQQHQEDEQKEGGGGKLPPPDDDDDDEDYDEFDDDKEFSFVKWQYVDVYELIDILSGKIDLGYTFPLNPKWVLCDGKGWKQLWDKLMTSSKANSRGALDCWFPPTSGVREQINSVSARYPDGFQVTTSPAAAAAGAASSSAAAAGVSASASAAPAIEDLYELDAEMAMELANYELIQYLLDMDQAKKGGKEKGSAASSRASASATMPGAYSSTSDGYEARMSMPGAYSSTDDGGVSGMVRKATLKQGAYKPSKPGAYTSSDDDSVGGKGRKSALKEGTSKAAPGDGSRFAQKLSGERAQASRDDDSGLARKFSRDGAQPRRQRTRTPNRAASMPSRQDISTPDDADDLSGSDGDRKQAPISAMGERGNNIEGPTKISSIVSLGTSYHNGPVEQSAHLLHASSNSLSNHSLLSMEDESDGYEDANCFAEDMEQLGNIQPASNLNNITGLPKIAEGSDREGGDQQINFVTPFSGYEQANDDVKSLSRHRWILVLGCSLCIVVISIAIVVAVVLTSGGESEQPVPPVSNSTEKPLENAEFYKQRGILQSQLAHLSSDPGVLDGKASPQGMALDWLTSEVMAGTGGDTVDDSRIAARYALAAIYFATNGVDWIDNTRHISPAHECGWKGVTCNERMDIIGLDYEENNLVGSLPEEIAALTTIESLSFRKNFISNRIPSAISRLTGLIELNLSENALTGPLPATIGELSLLRFLELGDNRLSSSLPTTLEMMASLQKLGINRNLFSGEIPSLRGLTQLELLEAERNNFVGSLDVLWSPSLRFAHLPLNRLSGTLPISIFDSVKLEYFSCYENLISGTVPPNLGNLGNLKFLDIDGNYISGTFPWSSFPLGAPLERLAAGNNFWTQGPLPTDVARLSSLQRLDFVKGNLIGQLPDALFQLLELRRLVLRSNYLSGTLPANISLASKLDHIDLAFNIDLGGSLPDAIGELTALTNLRLESCSFAGTLPPSMGNMTLLSNIELSQNMFSGTIPQTFENLQQLGKSETPC